MSRMRCIGILAIALISFSFAPLRHDFHISKGMVEYVADAESMQVTLHVFIDDLELALEEQGAPKLFLGTEKESHEGDKYVEQYLQRHFTMEVDGRPIEFLFLGKEISDDYSALWFYLEARPVAKPQRVKIDYDLLTELYDDQKNIINFRGPDRKVQTLLFAKGDTEEWVEL